MNKKNILLVAATLSAFIILSGLYYFLKRPEDTKETLRILEYSSKEIDITSYVPIFANIQHPLSLEEYQKEIQSFYQGQYYNEGNNINSLLVYENIEGSKQKIMPMGYFILIIRYHPNIDRETFLIELNGQNISEHFNPCPYGTEIVTFKTLFPGTNNLKLSISEKLPRGSSKVPETDHDYFTFIMENSGSLELSDSSGITSSVPLDNSDAPPPLASHQSEDLIIFSSIPKEANKSSPGINEEEFIFPMYKGQKYNEDEYTNNLLVYDDPHSSNNVIPEGRNFFISIKYHQDIDPESFKVELNSNDISKYFRPHPGGTDRVTFKNLEMGKNELTFSIGQRVDSTNTDSSDGTIHTDVDRFEIFMEELDLFKQRISNEGQSTP